MTDEPNPQALPNDVDSVVKKYNELKAYIARKKKDLETDIAPQVKAQTVIKGYLTTYLRNQRVDSFKTKHGTVFKAIETDYKVVDGDAFWNFLAESGLWHLVKLEPITSALNEFIAEEKERRRAEFAEKGENPPDEVLEVGLLPPGLNRSRFQHVRVRKK
jgi:hypothetical protein